MVPTEAAVRVTLRFVFRSITSQERQTGFPAFGAAREPTPVALGLG